MKALKLVLTAICLTICGTAAADPLKQCIAEVCKRASPATSSAAFLALEKTDHPFLTNFTRRYQAQLDELRLAGEKQVRESIKVLGETKKVSDLIRQMSDRELMTLFVERKPWNLGKDLINGEFAVIARPLTSDQQDGEVIKQIFARLLSVSPLYVAELKIGQLNMEPQLALSKPKNQSVESFVLTKIKERMAELPLNERQVIEQKVNNYQARFQSLKNQFGEKIYAWLGSLDLEIQVKLAVFLSLQMSEP